jgi:UDP-N-acetylmuramoyl-tripeptide--D-alanyl-D-alanine ligase
MLELGDKSDALHEAVGRYVATRADLLFAVGGEAASRLADAAVTAGMPPDVVRYCATSEIAGEAVLSVVSAGDVVLVKGSRGVRTDLVVERLKAEHD